VGVFVAALFFPVFRAAAYAPVRELLLPPPAPITISLLYSTEKEAWLNEVIPGFEESGANINGHPIRVTLEKMGSWEINTALLDGTRKPVLISPASMLQIAALQDASTAQFGKSLVNPADSAACRPIVKTPLTLVAWKERADVLWGQQPGASLWLNVHDALVNPQGWAAYNHADWGYVKFGHTDPLKSNSGFMTILLMAYGYQGKTSDLSAADILSDAEFQQWFLETEASIGQFEHSTGPLMEKMVAYGPSTYDFVAVYEATAIEQAANAVGRYGELRVYYPSPMVWSDHPFCLLQAEWVKEEEAAAAQMLMEYLAAKPAQEAALLRYGFRPTASDIPLEQPGSSFDRYAANGFRADLSALQEVQIPAGNVLSTLRDFWSRNVRR